MNPLIKAADPSKAAEYWLASIPIRRDFELLSVLTRPLSSAEIDQLPEDAVNVMNAFARRAATMAGRTNDHAWVHAGAVAALISITLRDTRNILIGLAMLRYVATNILDCSPNDVDGWFHEVGLGTEPDRELIAALMFAGPALGEFNMTAAQGSDGFQFVPLGD